MAKTPSPCIDVCKYKREGHCIACSMTKAQKNLFRGLKKDEHRKAFVEMLVTQQEQLGQYEHWARQYRKKCQKKKVKPTSGVSDVA